MYDNFTAASEDNYAELDDYNYIGISMTIHDQLQVREIQYVSISDAITSFGGFYKSWTLFITLTVTPIILIQMRNFYAKEISKKFPQ